MRNFLDWMDGIWYKLFIFTVIMPLNGILLTTTPLIAIICILTQIPWFLACVLGVEVRISPFWITLFWKQNKWHKHGVIMHTIKVLYHVLKNKDYKFVIPAILHDIGKPFVAFQDEKDKLTGEYSFTDHEEKSYQFIKKWPLSKWTKDVIRYHYLIRDIKKCKEKGNLTRYHEKNKIWENLSIEMKRDIAQFMKYDDLGKK